LKTPIHLLISLYQLSDLRRESEILFCLRKNLDNIYVSKIIVLNEGFTNPMLFEQKIQQITINKRPTYRDFIPYMEAGAINIISNADIWFDHTLESLKKLRWHRKLMYVLTRREKNGRLFNVNGNSHDSWIFLGRPKALELADFYLGIPNCEQRLAAVMNDCGYYVLNPSKFIKTWHEHSSSHRAYHETWEKYEGCCLLVKPVGKFEIELLYAVFWYLKRKKYFYRRFNAKNDFID